mmetsp:Transcript_33387/g.53494  ORF Transcript_33387/g.53494 Transcript_33387/m.53494 type:complete len:246 (-) Transcript_33387:86-823(-)
MATQLTAAGSTSPVSDDDNDEDRGYASVRGVSQLNPPRASGQPQQPSWRRICYHFFCEINCCSKMVGSKYADQLRSFSFFINFFVVILIGFALPMNELTHGGSHCGWNKDKALGTTFDDLCKDGMQEYCMAQSMGLIWFIGCCIGLILNVASCVVNCMVDRYQMQMENGERAKNPIPKNCSAYLNGGCGLLFVLSGIAFQYGQTACDASMRNFASSLITSYAAAVILLTFGFWILPLSIMLCIFT